MGDQVMLFALLSLLKRCDVVWLVSPASKNVNGYRFHAWMARSDAVSHFREMTIRKLFLILSQ